MNSEEYKDSLYVLLDEGYNIKISKGKETFKMSVGASEEVSEYLSINVGDPVFKRTRITYDQFDKIVEYTLCYYRGDKFKYMLNYNKSICGRLLLYNYL